MLAFILFMIFVSALTSVSDLIVRLFIVLLLLLLLLFLFGKKVKVKRRQYLVKRFEIIVLSRHFNHI